MEQETEKRMADSYKITQGVQIGDKEVVFGIDEESGNAIFLWVLCEK